MKSVLPFLLQSVVVGLAAAFIVVLIRPDLLPGIATDAGKPIASYADAVDISAPAVANVYTKKLVSDASTPSATRRFRVDTSFASAVIIDPEGFLVTNYHVVGGAAEIRVQLSDGRIVEPTVIGVDAETDLALLKIEASGLTAVRLGSSANLRIGDVVLAIGNPYGLTKSVTQGIVSATGRGMLHLATFENFIQTDAAINTGNSGGALINSRGELVGINPAVLTQDASTEGIGFAIPVDLVRGVVDQIKQHGRVIRGWVGFRPEPNDLTNAERAALGLDDNIGIILADVYEASPAADADLRAGDVILEINGESVMSQGQARLLVAASNPGDRIDVVAWRDGERISTSVVAVERSETPP